MEEVTVVKLDTSKALNSLKSLRTELKNVKDAMSNLEEGSEAFQQAANKAGELKHKLDEINQAVKGASADFGDMLSNATQVTNGIIGGFTAAQGAMNLFGMESENVTKAIAKLQSMMAIGQGVAQIDAMTKALPKLSAAITGTSKAAKLLKTVLKPKVFLAITAALTGLSIIWNKFGDKIKEYIPLIGKLGEAFDKLKGKLGFETELEKNRKALEANVKTAQEELEQYKTNMQYRKLNSNAREKYDKIQEQLEWGEIQLKALREEIQLYRLNGNLLAVKRAEEEIKQLENNINWYKRLKQTILDSAESYKKLAENAEEAVKYTQPKYVPEKNPTIKQIDTSGLIKPAEGNGTTLATEEVTQIELIERALLRLDNQLNAGEITQKEYYENAIEWEQEKLQYIEAGTEEYLRQQGVVIDLQNEQKKLKDGVKLTADSTKEAFSITAKVMTASFQSASQLLATLAENEDANTKDGFEKQKKMQIAAATMNMLGGLISTWTSVMNPANAYLTIFGQIAMGAIQSASILGMGIANIQKIKQTSFDGGSTPSISSGAIANSIIAPNAYSQSVQGASTEQSIKDTRVYVLESDISNTQGRVSVQETENRY